MADEKREKHVDGEFIAKDPFGNSVHWGSTEEVSAYDKQVDRLLLEIGEYMGWDGDISEVYVSDMSSISDFCLEDSEVAAIAKKLGIVIDGTELLSVIAGRMSQVS